MDRYDLLNGLRRNEEVMFTSPNSGEFITYPADEVRAVIDFMLEEIEQKEIGPEFLIISFGKDKKVHYEQAYFNGFFGDKYIFSFRDSSPFTINKEDMIAFYPLK